MNLRERFNSLFSRSRENPIDFANEDSGEPAGTEDKEFTYDDLKNVPFAGEEKTLQSLTSEDDSATSVAESSVLIGEASSNSPELRAFKSFFKTDQRIKRELMDLAPDDMVDYNEEYRIEYVDHADKLLKAFKIDFRMISQSFHFADSIESSLDDFFKRKHEALALGHYDYGIPQKVYQDEFSNLRPQYVEEVKSHCVGYTLDNDFSELIDSAETVNELLHAYHSYILNNDEFLQSIPAIDEKENAAGYPIVLRGDQNNLSKQIFDAIPGDLDVGYTDIIAADQHIMMMVRDRGHALTISAEPDSKRPDQVFVEYNIPKICNTAMIEALPGLIKYTSNGARGQFEVPATELGDNIASFIAQVPTDDDMSRPGGVFYRAPEMV